MSESGAPFYGYLCKEAGCSVSCIRDEKSMEYLSYVISSFTMSGNAADAVMMKQTAAMAAASVVDPVNALIAAASAVAAGALIYIYRHRRIR